MTAFMRSAAALGAVCLATASFAGPIEDGEEALRRGDHQIALRFFKVAIKANPDDPRAWAGYEQAARGGETPTGAGPVAPASSAGPLAVGTDSTVGSAEERAQLDHIERTAFERYKRGERIFYNESFKRLIRGKRLNNRRIAQAWFDQRKALFTRQYERKNNGRLGVAATLFTPELYAYFACLRATTTKVDKDGAEAFWERDAADAFKYLEFFVQLNNLTYEGGPSAHRKLVNIDGIEDKVFLEDDRGVRYLPFKKRAPEKDALLSQDDMTVWFAPFDRNGNAIWDNAVSRMRLVIEGVQGEAERMIFRFPKSMFRRMLQGRES